MQSNSTIQIKENVYGNHERTIVNGQPVLPTNDIPIYPLYPATKRMANESAEAFSPLSGLRVEATGDDLALSGKTSIPAQLTNWSFGQLCRKISAPAGYLEGLPASLAAQNINHGLEELGQVDDSRDANLFVWNWQWIADPQIHCQFQTRILRLWNCPPDLIPQGRDLCSVHLPSWRSLRDPAGAEILRQSWPKLQLVS